MSAIPPTFPVTFPTTGRTLTCTANSPESIGTIFQHVVAQLFGLPIVDSEGNLLPTGSPVWQTVRVGWQQQGQPAWEITPNTCIITAYTDDDPYSRVSDVLYTPNDYQSINEQRGYTQAWKMRFVCYGQNAFTNGVLIVEGMTFDWVHDILAAQNIYAVTEWKRPVVTTDWFDGQWWQRADVELLFYELVLLNTTVPTGASVGITVVKENLLNETVTVNI
jgi:hypothetical protein